MCTSIIDTKAFPCPDMSFVSFKMKEQFCKDMSYVVSKMKEFYKPDIVLLITCNFLPVECNDTHKKNSFILIENVPRRFSLHISYVAIVASQI